MRKLSMFIWMLILINMAHISMAIDPNDSFGRECTDSNKRSVCGDQLVCINNTCTNCMDDSQCSSTKNIICKNSVDTLQPKKITNQNINKICEHKDIFSNVNGWDIGTMILVFFIGMFAAVSGIGGGGFFVVIILTMMEFDVSMAARLSTATIFGMSIANLLNYLPLVHPFKNKPLVDFNSLVVMESYTLAGTVFGVILNIIFPNWLISLLLVMILFFVGAKVMLR